MLVSACFVSEEQNMSSYKCTLNPELQKYAKQMLNEDPLRRAEDIDHIRQWIKKQPHLRARTGKFSCFFN